LGKRDSEGTSSRGSLRVVGASERDSAAPPSTIAVIGGGFSGVAVAAQLLRRGRPVRVLLVNRFGPLGRGVAYRTRIEAHVLNVPAGGMSALPEEPDHFLNWAQGRNGAVSPGTFVSRRLYGEYLESVLREAESASAGTATLDRVVGEVLDAEPGAGGVSLTFADGSRRTADRVVLALGNYSPANPAAEGAEFYDSDRYVRDPWIRGSLDVVQPGETVLMLGTGLTTLDIALDLAGRGVALPLRAVSRHGLLPQPHAPARMGSQPPPELLELPMTARGLLAAVRRASRAPGADWRGVVGALRGATPGIWQELYLAERARFLRHVRPYWDVHRHRAAPPTWEAIDRMRRSGEFQVRAGRVVRYEPTADGVRVLVRPRGQAKLEAVFVDRVVNCTGPSSDVARIGDRLLDALRRRGLAVPDPLRLGVEVSDDLALLGADGRPSDRLFLVGPLLKARFWEATAVPELRGHARSVAERLLP
jgi:uncharacterized NAD(P)/FAD-binding protein YdhS